MEKFKIYPPIGVARLGGSPDQFFLCPENNNSLGIEISNSGNESEVKDFKDATGQIKRQGARFRIFGLDAATGEYQPIDTNFNSVEWTVHLVNKKAAVLRPADPPLAFSSVPLPLRPANTEELIIDAGEKSISGKNQTGVLFDSGKYKTDNVFLGELKTDKDGNLIVLGGHGISKSPSNQPIGGYYYSKDWYDDTSDGYVKAVVKLQDGTETQALAAWVIVTPPDYAPSIKGVVTLYDIIEQVAIDKGIWRPTQVPSFANNILPILDRFRNLKWVNNLTDFSIIYEKNVLADNSPANQAKRKEASGIVQDIEKLLEGHVSGLKYQLTQYQHSVLKNWEDGNFTNDIAAPMVSLNKSDQLVKDILDTTVGQGFCPGIEGGIIVKNPDIYKEAFRLDATQVTPGDITGLMALPWQADFLKCSGNWWPSQRPDVVKASDGNLKNWARGITDHKSLINNFNKLGFVKPKETGGTIEQIEDERSL